MVCTNYQMALALCWDEQRPTGAGMDALIQLDASDPDELRDLHEWLCAERELRGNVSLAPASISDEELGAITDVISVAVGAGGAGTVLASLLVTWLQTRRTVVRLVVQRGKHKVILDIESSEGVLPMLERLLESGDEP
jgi:hypothetical protein